MFKIDEDLTIHLTRGDGAVITVGAEQDGVLRPFLPGEKVSLVVVPKNGYSKGAVLRKDVIVGEEGAEIVDIVLYAEDTKIGDLIDKKVTYWYNIVINDNQTIIGSDENGEKKLILYPEGGEE